MDILELPNPHMPDREDERALLLALLAYSEGRPVVVLDDEQPAGLLHGAETLEAIIDTGAPLEVYKVEGIPLGPWNDSDWLEALEAARTVFLKGTNSAPSSWGRSRPESRSCNSEAWH